MLLPMKPPCPLPAGPMPAGLMSLRHEHSSLKCWSSRACIKTLFFMCNIWWQEGVQDVGIWRTSVLFRFEGGVVSGKVDLAERMSHL